MKRILETALIVGAAFAAGGCLPAYVGSEGQSAAQMDEATISASIANGAYRYSPQFAPLNTKPYDSVAAPGAKINVWVTSSLLAAYSKIVPDKNGSAVTLSAGGMIVREVLTATGGVDKLTLMVKGPSGYNDALGDYWFAVTGADGTPLVDSGNKLAGKLPQCFKCHVDRGRDDFLFGVPASAQHGG